MKYSVSRPSDFCNTRRNRPFWEIKLTRNRERDATANAALRRLGWRVLTVWECETKKPDQLLKRLARSFPP